MILERLRLVNFRCYAGTVDIEFSTDAVKNTTVIQGTNGGGKTSILQALNFVLYGQRAVTADSPLVNNSLILAAREHAPARATVMLWFRDSGISYKLSRAVRGYMVGERPHQASGTDDVSLTFVTRDGLTKVDPFPDATVENLLPSPIRTFFLFDGDRIADFTKPGRERDDTINKAVNDVLHIEALSRAVEHTKAIAADKRRVLEKSGAPAVEKTSSEISVHEAMIDSRRRSLLEAEQSLRFAEERLASIDEQLSSILQVARLQESRKKLETQRSACVERGTQLRKQLSRAILSTVPALASKKVSAAATVLGRYKARHEIPARIADYFLKDLLEKGNCICGRCIDDGSGARDALHELLSSLYPDSLQDVATQLSGRLRPLQDDAKETVGRVVRNLEEIKANGDAIDRLDHELERVGASIDDSALEQAQELNRERGGIAKIIREADATKARANRDLDNAIKYKTSLEEKLKLELAKRAGYTEVNNAWIVARDCYESLAKVKSLLETRLRSTLGERATEILRKLVSDSKKYFFAEIKVDSGFILRVLDNEGRDVRSHLSMGETQVSSLAFMLAMTRLGGQEAPLVVDTPLARLDASVRANAADWLPQLSPQLILLVTDAEYGQDVQEHLAPRVGARIRLAPSASGTTIASEIYA
jgi:DNA sulfur modification protein DndD